MAQVIKKYQEGGKTKPTIIKIDGQDRNYDDIERNVWSNFDAYAKQQGWDSSTQQAVREYLEYALPGMKSGELTYDHNVMTGVLPQYESDGTFNTTGHGLLKRDITNDARAGATLGVGYLNDIMNIIPQYKAPKLKDIGLSITADITNSIIKNYYNGNTQAFNENWAKLTPKDRYKIFTSAVSSLTYDPDEYDNVEDFKQKRQTLLNALANGYSALSPDIENAYAALGGYGLNDFINGTVDTTTDTTTDTTSDELKPPTDQELEQQWTQDAIHHGYYTPEAIENYKKLQRQKYDNWQKQPAEELEDLQTIDNYSKVSSSYENYTNYRKNTYHKNFDAINEHNDKFVIDPDLKEDEPYDVDQLDGSQFKKVIEDLRNQFYNLEKSGTNTNYMYFWRGALRRIMKASNTVQMIDDDGTKYDVYIIPDSENFGQHTVMVYIPSKKRIKVVSMYNIPKKYATVLNRDFVTKYNKMYPNFQITEDWQKKYSETITRQQEREVRRSQGQQQTEQEVEQDKHGGILKAQDGAAIQNVILTGDTIGDTDYWANDQQYLKQVATNKQKEAKEKNITVEELEAQKQQAKETVKTVKRRNTAGHFEWDASTISDLTGLLGDIVATIGSLVGGGGFDPVTWGGAAVSFLGHTVADFSNPANTTWDALKGTAINLGLAGASLIPIFGAAGPVAKMTKLLIKYGPLLYSAYEEYPEITAVVEKANNGEDLTTEDWMTLGDGLRLILGTAVAGKEIHAVKRATKPGESTRSVKISENGNERALKITDENVWNSLKGKSANEADIILREQNILPQDASVAGRKQFGIVGKSMPQLEETNKSWLNRHVLNRQLKSASEVKPNQRKDWLRAQGLPTNERARRWYDKVHRNNPATQTQRNSILSRQTMPDEQWERFSGQPATPANPAPTANPTSVANPAPANPSLQAPSASQAPIPPISLTEIRITELKNQLKNRHQSLSSPRKQTGSKTAQEFQNAIDNNQKIVAYMDQDGKITWALEKDVPKSMISRLKLNSRLKIGNNFYTLAQLFAKGENVIYDIKSLKNGGNIFLNNVILRYNLGGDILKYEEGDQITNEQEQIVNPSTGDILQKQSNGVYKVIGNTKYNNKPKLQRIGEDVVKFIKNINPADAIALGRALWGESVNNKAAELTKQMSTALLDPQRQSAILHGDYTSKMLAEELAGKIMAASQKPITSDAGVSQAAKLEAAQKATEALRQGNAADSEMYWKTFNILQNVNNENANQEVLTSNENRGKITASNNLRLQIEAARLAANFEQIWQPFFAGMENRMREHDALRKNADIAAWQHKITSKYSDLTDQVKQRYNTIYGNFREDWKTGHTNADGTVDWNGLDEAWLASDSAKNMQNELTKLNQQQYDELYEGLSDFYTYSPFQLKRRPDIATPGIVSDDIHYIPPVTKSKQGGTLSAEDRKALKMITETNKNIRSANRETNKNIRHSKTEHRKAMALVSELAADLIKKATGI